MKKMYVAPEVELVEIAVEQGFAVSDYEGELPGYDEVPVE